MFSIRWYFRVTVKLWDSEKVHGFRFPEAWRRGIWSAWVTGKVVPAPAVPAGSSRAHEDWGVLGTFTARSSSLAMTQPSRRARKRLHLGTEGSAASTSSRVMFSKPLLAEYYYLSDVSMSMHGARDRPRVGSRVQTSWKIRNAYYLAIGCGKFCSGDRV